MTSVLEDNLKALSRCQAHILESVIQSLARMRDFGPFETVRGRRGLPTLRFTDAAGSVKHAHSLFDPERDARKRAAALAADKKNVYIFAGLGLGYDVTALLPLLPLDSCIVIFEPSLQAFAAALRAVSLQHILEHPRVIVIPGDDLETYRYPLIDFLGDFPPTLFELVPAAYVDLFPGFGANVAGILREIHDICVNVKHTRDTFLKKNLINTAKNFPLILEQPPLESLRGIFKNIPAVIIGPGPSLYKSLPALNLLKSKCVLISLNTTAPFLVENGIVPHFIVSIDPQHKTLDKAGHDLPEECIWLFSDFASHKLVSVYKNNSFIFPSSDSVRMSLAAAGLPSHIISTGPSASTAALLISDCLGFCPVAFIGIDFTLAKGKRYCWDAPAFSSSDAESINIFNTLSTSTNDLLAYSVEFSKLIHNTNATVHDIRESGINISAIPISSWKDFFLNMKTDCIDISSAWTVFDGGSKNKLYNKYSSAQKLKSSFKSQFQAFEKHLSQLHQLSCAMLSPDSQLNSADESVHKLFHEYTALASSPLWHLCRDSYHPLPVSSFDLTETDDTDKIASVISSLNQYIMDTIENIRVFFSGKE